MKKICKITFITIFLLITCTFSFGQCCPYINSVSIEPINPDTNDYLKIITQVTTPSLGSLISKSHYIQSDTIFIDACYFAGVLTQPQIFIDTFNIGYLTMGFYTIYFRANQSSDNNICDPSDFKIYSSVIEIAGISGVNSFNQVSLFELYPNPAYQQQTLLITTDKSVALSVSLFDITGRKIKEIYQGKSIIGNNVIENNVSTLPEAMYLYEIKLGNEVIHIRFVKH